jgi:predicted AAA+ superfamily ATPase
MGVMVESVVGDHLRRWRGPFTLYHRASQGSEEIDFVTFADNARALIEVKYRTTVKAADKRALRKYGGGILVTRKELFFSQDNNVCGLPAPSFMAGLPSSLTLFPSIE